MNPGDLVVAGQDIVTRLVTIPKGTMGLIEYEDRGVCKVQFKGRIVQYNIPIDWLIPVCAVAWWVDDGIRIEI